LTRWGDRSSPWLRRGKPDLKNKGTSNIEHPTPNIEFVKSVSSVVKKVFAVVVEDEPSPSNFAAPRDENDDEEEYNPFSSQTSAFSLQP
jgi:hypothetical protein